MGIRFYGGPYDGVEAEYSAINQYATVAHVFGDLGSRPFVLMPPRESWVRLRRGEPAETSPFYPYEVVSTTTGARFEWAPGEYEQALLEARLKVEQPAKTALSTLTDTDRSAVIKAVANLQKTDPEFWPKEQVTPIGEGERVYMVRVGYLVAFVRKIESGQLELFDIVREDTLRLFLERFRELETAR